ncbi:hypothetical protein [Mangrovihabitans endophyticus]|uniref:Uncharacterized protein n=1 Tax=Mangrovihabitans endophyticus TaxID=1751298 RepID=A0A8J3BXF7_9ACTN|nr:hypothetical protein [Mangrovihabitans endophyticus]GGK87833.1 hypothetical protein GCM10012284_22360 [Mangrovihabitans endophyticus]
MASWILVPCLVSLRSEFNRLAPGRDHTSDGSIGDAAHAQSSSDHNPDETGRTPYHDADHINEVHAIDVDDDLRKSGWTMQRCVQIIVTRHRTGKDNRLQNVIYNRRIWSRSWGWTARTYTGTSPHTEHAHFSARYTTAQESDTRPWGLLEEDEDMPTAAEIAAEVVKRLDTAPIRHNRTLGGTLDALVARGTQPDGESITSLIGRNALDQGIPNGITGTKTTAWAALLNLGQAVGDIRDLVGKLSVTVASMAAGDVDPQHVNELKTLVDRVDAAVPTELLSGTPEETAAALRMVLGDRAAEVGRLLNQG